MADSWPEAASTYQALCNGDPVAQSDFVVAFLDPLVMFLNCNFPAADSHDRLTAAEDAILSVIRDPAVFDPSRGSLPTFLRMAASADLANIQARERRHQRRRDLEDCVELQADGGNSSAEQSTNLLPSFDDPSLAAVITALDAKEWQVFGLMREGERRTGAFAAVLGIGHLPPVEQATEVKKVKDRILKRFQRAGGRA
ncbi:MAG: hypothetical protein C0467_28870 [Planctomycetaceae bacterium]|nr:hypothetical protein [Planctomycetaceae bacterium]